MEQETEKKLIERLADLEHQQWVHWENYKEQKVDSFLPKNPDGLKEQIKKWERLRETEYAQLTEKEKESDRDWARKALAIVKAVINEEDDTIDPDGRMQEP